ncbi:40S ribosomal protein s2-2 [Phtheirospermum japonicum]|uniref:40S ribosomal protein S2 n=1 Tax=Phtheirospermum japonicum TaxID=374723 RepID=A0A830C9J5_9LAMI|nr:40S ribosomal protein s2-2 [Phtheirospermum japonicum]
MKIMPVQKQIRAGQRTQFKAFVVFGDNNGYVGLGVKCSKEVAISIRGAIILAKLSVILVRRGYWGNKIEKLHTVPCKITGKCGSVTCGWLLLHVVLVFLLLACRRRCSSLLVLRVFSLLSWMYQDF